MMNQPFSKGNSNRTWIIEAALLVGAAAALTAASIVGKTEAHKNCYYYQPCPTHNFKRLSQRQDHASEVLLARR